MKVLYDWLKDYVGDDIPPLDTLEEAYTFHAFEIDGIEQVGTHDVIDVKVLPDRSSDCLSHRGIARELGSITGKPLATDPLREPVVLSPRTDKLSVTIENPDNCRRFSSALITNVRIGPSPEWLKSRLEALGQRSINNVVDATNYVMLALGQPLHAYDADKFPHDASGWHFGVRMARAGESVTTLTNDIYTLTEQVQLIVADRSDTPVGIAGIKGGKPAEIDANTTNIIIEAANFNPVVTRRATQVLKLQTDASKRFENNISPELTVYGLQACVLLIRDIAHGTLEGYLDVYPHPIKQASVSVSLQRINARLGLALTATVVEDIFTRLGFSVTGDSAEWQVTPSFERMDVTIAEDLIEEVGRIHGYAHVASVVPAPVVLTEYNARHYYSEQIRSILVEEGFSEVITSSFRKKDVIELQNALASDKRFLRSTLEANIREVLDRNMPNADLLGLSHIAVFEIGTVFHKLENGKGIREQVSLACGVRMKQQGYTQKDDVRLKEVMTKIESALGVRITPTVTQGVFECNLTEIIAKLPVPTAYEPYTPKSDILFKAYSQYPFVSRDIALWVPEGVTEEMVRTIMQAEAGALLTRISCFDEFYKDGKISYAFRLIFQSFERTLTDEEIGAIMVRITTALTGAGYEVR